MISDLLMCANSIATRVKFAKIDLLAEPDAYLRPARPIAKDLFWQVVAQTRNKNRQNLWVRLVNDLADAGLRRKKLIWVVVQISLAFGVKTNNMASALGA